ncbi:uroporphyrinogen decarboxylase family protein [Archaeoglobus fulgidus]|uniref:Uroporphyrinogen decarboxylase (URO-D) domain-containing protein n=1 Tax=Archaeoglobus fulgidus (strain ATCC 49558 / DSM 4304 / JCM 9628 / NBRC 100126 / VC-16) TaxID=224325 RepID=O30228_ARCFU|nr:uroporphyrinogen decarboxylase family protein [Archaeoglobus fulgidus]AAB91225.1 predicted coding region AF_0007 [Archaeoglobus fulgidus DSM 4304]
MNAEQLMEERRQRIEDVVKGKEPDRVPVTGATTVWHGSYAGYTAKEVLFDYEKCKDAWLKVAKDFDFDSFTVVGGLEGMIYTVALLEQPDMSAAARFILGPTHLVLQDVYTRWPGYELEENAHPQFIGKEIMKVEEYDQLIENPLEFINKVAMPRINRKLANVGSAEYNAALAKYGAELARFGAFMADVSMELAKLGYPTIPMSWAYAPLDLISDFLRDIKNMVMDLYRYPDKVKEAVEAVKPLIIKAAEVSAPPKEIRKQVFGTDVVECFYPLHLNEYLSPKLYNEFYWPYLNEVLHKVADMGQVNFVLFEGRHDAHLETLLEAPKKKVVGVFEKTDPRKVREVLGDHVILVSGPPNSLLIGGTPQKVEEYMKSLLEDCKEGGMMIWPGVDGGISRDARPENVKAVIEAVKKYGTY